jgi:ketosteroid isomerase-like protein
MTAPPDLAGRATKTRRAYSFANFARYTLPDGRTPMAIPDCKFTHHGGMENGNHYAVEWTISGTIFGQEFACRGASLGETDDEGRIVHNRDYWDSRSFPEMPAGPENPDLAELQAKHS